MRLKAFIFGSGIGAWLLMGTFLVLGMNRYPVGQPVPASVYTEPFDPCDLAYKFFQIRYGDPNNPKWQSAPDEWIKLFGNNERTMLLQTISELRVVVANLGKKTGELENRVSRIEKQFEDYSKSTGEANPLQDPNSVRSTPNAARTDPGEGKK